MFNFLAGFRFPHDVIDILVVAYVIYRILLLIKGTRAFQILLGLIVILGAFIASQRLELVTLNTILNAFFSSLILVVVVLFQNDIRRALAQMGMSSFLRPSTEVGSGSTTDMVEELAKATVSLANKKIGSITVIERQTRLRSHIETGSFVDGMLSSELLQSIFLPYSPIHDGAVIVADGRIIWAGCFLPLTTRVDLEQELGRGHVVLFADAFDRDAQMAKALVIRFDEALYAGEGASHLLEVFGRIGVDFFPLRIAPEIGPGFFFCLDAVEGEPVDEDI